ncbi:MAG TPA: TatD family hydrolase [Pyrinomonadaceae bacterium]|jgi:TatD DNase family protein|nr:TatD family hydrolase [Pyrinomonadaceae bacterium]
MFVDSHAHIDGEEYDADRAEVIERARDAGVRAILNVGTGDPHSGSLERAVEVAEQFESVYAVVGVHPHDARLFDEAARQRLARLLGQSSRVIALGEIGLDYHYDHSPREVQRRVFCEQLRMARSMALPVIIHSRSADDDTVSILRDEWRDAPRGGIMHCFGGSASMAQSVLALGFMVSFAGNLTFRKADSLREVARLVPLDRLLVETDCPFLAPVPFRGRRNEPARVVETARCLAELHDTDAAEMGCITTGNFHRFFNLEAPEGAPGEPFSGSARG